MQSHRQSCCSQGSLPLLVLRGRVSEEEFCIGLLQYPEICHARNSKETAVTIRSDMGSQASLSGRKQVTEWAGQPCESLGNVQNVWWIFFHLGWYLWTTNESHSGKTWRRGKGSLKQGGREHGACCREGTGSEQGLGVTRWGRMPWGNPLGSGSPQAAVTCTPLALPGLGLGQTFRQGSDRDRNRSFNFLQWWFSADHTKLVKACLGHNFF